MRHCLTITCLQRQDVWRWSLDLMAKYRPVINSGSIRNKHHQFTSKKNCKLSVLNYKCGFFVIFHYRVCYIICDRYSICHSKLVRWFNNRLSFVVENVHDNCYQIYIRQTDKIISNNWVKLKRIVVTKSKTGYYSVFNNCLFNFWVYILALQYFSSLFL